MSIKKSSFPATIRIPSYASIEDWISHESVSFSLDSSQSFNSAVDRVMACQDSGLKLLGFGEALHGNEDLLILRNRLFQRLVERHGFSAIAIESSFSRAHMVSEYISGASDRESGSYEELMDAGFSHGFGRMKANRELVEWMKDYNSDPAHSVKLQFYGSDSPTEMTSSDSPRQVLRFVLDFLASVGSASGRHHRKLMERRERIEALLGMDDDWQSFEAIMDPDKSPGASQRANTLRIETEDLMSELLFRRPELTAKSSRVRYLEAAQHLAVARQLLNYHATLARKSETRTAELLGIRDSMMADNLAYATIRERGRGRVLAFAHNSHLQRGRAEWLLGSEMQMWWPAGSHLQEMLGSGYTVIGSALGVSPANGIGLPEKGTIEAGLTGAFGPGKFIATYAGRSIVSENAESPPIRSGSRKNSTYFPLTARSLSDFDWLAVLDESG